MNIISILYYTRTYMYNIHNLVTWQIAKETILKSRIPLGSQEVKNNGQPI